MKNYMQRGLIFAVAYVVCMSVSMTWVVAGESTIQTSDGQTWGLQADGGYLPLGGTATSSGAAATSGNVIQTSDGRTWVQQPNGGYIAAGTTGLMSSSPTVSQTYYSSSGQTSYHQPSAVPTRRSARGSQGGGGSNAASKIAKGLFFLAF